MNEPNKTVVIRILQGTITTDSFTFSAMAGELEAIMDENRPIALAESLLATIVTAFIEWSPQEMIGRINDQPVRLQFYPYPEKEESPDVPDDRTT